MNGDAITAILRAYPQQRRQRKPAKRGASWEPYDTLVVIDTETSTDETLTMRGFEGERWDGIRQSLLFGTCQVFDHTGNGDYALRESIIFYPDDLPAPGLKRLRAACKPLGIKPIPQTKFLAHLYWLALKTTRQRRVAIVGFNLAFDLTRIALNAESSRRYPDCFTLRFWEYTGEDGEQHPNEYKPNLRIENAGDFRFYTWSKTRPKNPETGIHYTVQFQNNFVDCQTLLRALFNLTPSLDGALAFMAQLTGQPVEQKHEIEGHGVITPEYVVYGLRDTELTAKLAIWLLKQAASHPIDDPAQLYSTASLSKAYLRAMGIDGPPEIEIDGLPESLDSLSGLVMTTYYGARTEVTIRNVEVPVVYLDFLSMYPTVMINAGLWDFMRAGRLVTSDKTDEIRAWLDTLTLDDLFKPETWPDMNAIACIQPDGDIVPVRGVYGGDSVNIALPVTHSEQALWYTLHDLAASKMLTGRTPHIIRAIAFEPGPPRKGLLPVRLFDTVPIDPQTDNLFKLAIEERKRVKAGTGQYADLNSSARDALQQTLKILANSTYGYYVEMNDKTIKVQSYDLFGLDTAQTVKDWIETTGHYFCPPVATFITSGARLMLALLERVVRDAGGKYVFCDTDSMAIVARPERETIPLVSRGADGVEHDTPITALAWSEVDAIIQRFESLNPYTGTETVLKVEDVNYDPGGNQRQLYAYAICSKRHCLYTRQPDGEIEPVKVTYSAMGAAINPDPDKAARRQLTGESYVEQRACDLWLAFLRDGHTNNVPHIEAPLLRQRSISTPHVFRLFGGLNKGKPYAEQIKPFSFFLEASALFEPVFGLLLQRRSRVVFRAYERDPDRWLSVPWMIRDSGEFCDLMVVPEYSRDNLLFGSGIIMDHINKGGGRIQSYREFFESYVVHPEIKFNGIDGEPCNKMTRGLLSRRTVEIIGVAYTGKEGKALQRITDHARPVIADYADEFVYPGAVINRIPVTENEVHNLIRRVLLAMPRQTMEKAMRLERSVIARHLKADRFPRHYADDYRTIATQYAERQTGERGLAALYAWPSWREMWEQIRGELDTDDIPELMKRGLTRKAVENYLYGYRKPTVKTIRKMLNMLEPVYRERLTDPPPGARIWPRLPLAPFLRGLAFWQYVRDRFALMAPEEDERLKAWQGYMAGVLGGEIEIDEGQEYIETLSDTGWTVCPVSPEHEIADQIAEGRENLFYRLRTMGRGHIDQRDIEGARIEAGRLLAEDRKLKSITALRAEDRKILNRLADSDDEIVIRMIDQMRDRRLRGRLTTRGNVRAGGEHFRTIGMDEAVARLRERWQVER